jgi:hypothetical protein
VRKRTKMACRVFMLKASLIEFGMKMNSDRYELVKCDFEKE